MALESSGLFLNIPKCHRTASLVIMYRFKSISSAFTNFDNALIFI